jgi:methylmalonyl-CoA mutase C-terminal domain/subunit
VAELLKEEGAEDVILLAGGTIPEKDVPHLAALGFRHVFTPGTPFSKILSALEQELHR